ncbi:hypothetical protein K3495_g1189 [Podosphaera aphanis]|nr:hypothetical protein K3495_g1189 [Podosphaera aphanis]
MLTMSSLAAFTTWVQDHGVAIRGVSVHAFEGRGVGIRAEAHLEPGVVLLHVPHAALRTQHSVRPDIAHALRRASVHGLLAADHALGAVPEAWRAILPPIADLHTSTALCWPPQLHEWLPPGARHVLRHQQTKFAADWAAVSAAFPQLDYDHYRYAWLLVNTRTFYYRSASHRGAAPARDDCMALNPFADCFNHSSTPSAEVQRSTTAFRIIATRTIQAGEEVSISYGNHSNDFLMIEYGFILDENPWDEILLDPYILPLLTPAQKIELESVSYLGNYKLDHHAVCYRTQVALRIISLSRGRWKSFVRGVDDGERDQPEIDRVLAGILRKCQGDAVQTLGAISSGDGTCTSQRQLLTRRWQQVDLLLQGALDKVQG